MPDTPTHATVLAAIDKARMNPEWHGDALRTRNAHLDDLRATAERHQPAFDIATRPVCPRCKQPAPCPDYQQVIDRLQGWGVL
jgi:hypothetical protein